MSPIRHRGRPARHEVKTLCKTCGKAPAIAGDKDTLCRSCRFHSGEVTAERHRASTSKS
jgi:hypothetical protein